MPCSWSRFCPRRSATNPVDADALPAPTSTPDVEHWKTIRKANLRHMRKQVRHVVLLMALIEALRVGPIELVWAGKHGYPAPTADDFGIAYSVGYFLSWLYVCIFMVIWMPLFEWWVPKLFPETPEDSSKPSLGMKIVCFLKKFNMIVLPISIGISLSTYVIALIYTFIYVDSRPKGSSKFPKNTRRNWAVRAFMLIGIAITTSLGHGAFQILENLDLAKVKTLEYAIIVVPVQINFGILLGTVMQFRMEKRIARKQALMLKASKTENGAVEEKAALLDV